MSDDFLTDKIVQRFTLGLLALVVLFLVYGLVRDDGDNDADVAPISAGPATPHLPKQTSHKPQIGCQQSPGAAAVGAETIPPNPGVSARRSGRRATISVTIPTSTQECRVAKIRVELDSTTDKLRPASKTLRVLVGPPVREVKVTLPKEAGRPQIVRAFSVTADKRASTGATVSVR